MGSRMIHWVLLILSLNTVIAKRCHGRMRSGSSCRAVCNYTTGKWEKHSCDGFGRPAPNPADFKPCLTVSQKPCKFPLWSDTQRYDTCTKLNNASRPWCPTVGGKHVTELGPEDWDYCETEQAEKKCLEKPGYCSYYCETPRDGLTTCHYEYKRAFRLGIELPMVTGDCNDEKGLCSDQDACTNENDYDAEILQ